MMTVTTGEERTKRQLAARSWRPALVLAPLLGFALVGFAFSNFVAAIAGALLAFGGLVLLGGASTLAVDEAGVSLTRLGRTRRVEWSEATEVVCWVRQAWGGRVQPLRVEITATGHSPSPGLALPVSLRVDFIRRSTAQAGAQTVQEWAARAGIPASVRPWG
jgi:hypothetical protein